VDAPLSAHVLVVTCTRCFAEPLEPGPPG
jgi:hypothetical protein